MHNQTLQRLPWHAERAPSGHLLLSTLVFLLCACNGVIGGSPESYGPADGNASEPDDTDENGENSDDPGALLEAKTPVGQLTSTEYLATVRAAFSREIAAVVLPNDGNDGIFTTNAASEGIGDFLGYVTASEALGEQLAPSLVAACNWELAANNCPIEVFSPILPTLYRGGDQPADYAEIGTLVQTALASGAPVEVALTGAVSRVLLDERFLFHVEYGGEAGPTPNAVLLTGPELAARLSYLLVAGPPDDALRGVQDNLGPDALRQESRRLLGTASARDQVWRFTSEWLGINTQAPTAGMGQAQAGGGDECDVTNDCVVLYGAGATDCVDSDSDQSWCSCGGVQCVNASPGPSLERSMHDETRRFVEYVIFDSDAPLSELFTANYSFINSTLARHYGVPAPEQDWERYEFPASAKRRGILTHASFLSANGKPSRDLSWIFRGKIVYERLFCGELQEAPPDTISQEVELRETAAECASCHSIMDPIGRMFDGYDERGALVDRNSADAVVSAGSGIDGPYKDAVDFATAVGNSDELVDCFSRMWFRYGLARPATHSDLTSFTTLKTAVGSGASLRSSLDSLFHTPAFSTLYIAPEDQVCR